MNRNTINLQVIGLAIFILASGIAGNLIGADRNQDQSEKIRVACIGNSITYGAGIVGRQTNSYPAVLGRMLGSKYNVVNFGVSGSTLLKNGDKPYWKEKAFTDATEFKPNIVIIKLGTNDSKPQNWKYKDQFEADLRAMIEHFASQPQKPKIYLCLPVPVYETRWGINEKTVKEEIIPIIKKVAAEKGLPIIDLYTALSGKPEMFPDKIHPNADGARVMAETVYKALIAGK